MGVGCCVHNVLWGWGVMYVTVHALCLQQQGKLYLYMYCSGYLFTVCPQRGVRMLYLGVRMLYLGVKMLYSGVKVRHIHESANWKTTLLATL